MSPEDTGVPHENRDGSVPSEENCFAPPGLVVEVGIGQDSFVPVVRSQVVEMVSGPQGGGRFSGHHVLMAVRTEGFDVSEPVTTTVRILDSNQSEVARLIRLFPLVPDGAGGHVLFSLAPRISDCCAIESAAVFLQALVEDSQGAKGCAQIETTASICPAGGPSLCP